MPSQQGRWPDFEHGRFDPQLMAFFWAQAQSMGVEPNRLGKIVIGPVNDFVALHRVWCITVSGAQGSALLRSVGVNSGPEAESRAYCLVVKLPRNRFAS